MAYLDNIPQGADNPSTLSRPQFLENFSQLNTQISVNHVALTAGADNGKHTKIEFDTNHAAGVPVGTQSEIYTEGASPLLYFHNANFTAQMSGILAWCSFDGAAATPITITSGFNVTDVTKHSATSYTINFTNALPNADYGVLITGGTGTTPFSCSVLTPPAPTVNAVRIVVSGSNVPIITVLILGA